MTQSALEIKRRAIFAAVISLLSALEASRARLPALLDDLRELVDAESPSRDLAAVDAAARIVARQAAEAGLAVELVSAARGLHLHAAVRGTGHKRIVLLCHHDTVFPLGTVLRDPFRVDGARACGPGVADMKGGIVVALQAVRLLAPQPNLYGVLELVCVPDEEIRSEPFATIDRLAGANAVLCLECGRPGDGVVSARKAGRWPEVGARGRAAHAGVDGANGRNAVLALCREALRFTPLDGARDGLTVHLTSLHGGDVVNSVPGTARMSFDVRGWRTADVDWAVGQLRAFGEHEGVEIEIENDELTPALERTPAVAALAEAAVRIGRELGFPVHEQATGGASDACWTAAAGIPSLDGLGPIGALDHTPDEYIEIDSLASRSALLAGLIASQQQAQ